MVKKWKTYIAKPNKTNKKGKTYVAKPKTKGKKYKLKEWQTLT